MDYQPFKVDSNLLDRMTQVQSKKAAGLNALNQSNLFPQLNQTIEQAGQNYAAMGKRQKWQMAIDSLMKNPDVPASVKSFGPMIAQHPELAGQIMPALLRQQKQVPEWAPVPGQMSKTNRTIMYDKFSGDEKEGNIPASSTAGGPGSMAGVRQTQFTIMDMPSNQGPNTAGGAAYQVKVAARQGKNLIARAGSSQRLGLAQGDLARAVLRNSPTDEAMRNANFSNNTINTWNQLKQKLTSDPTAINNPKIRKEVFDIFDEMDKSATPFIENQLDTLQDHGLTVTKGDRRRQLGLNLPDIPFQESPDIPGAKAAPVGAPFSDPAKEARYQEWKKSRS